MQSLPKQFTDCDNCQKPLTACECGENRMPVCNVCGRAQVDCTCDEYSYEGDGEFELQNEFMRFQPVSILSTDYDLMLL